MNKLLSRCNRLFLWQDLPLMSEAANKPQPAILLAPGPFKECLAAPSVADAMEAGVRRILPLARLTKVPLCDGGSGFVERIVKSAGGTVVQSEVTGPLGEPVVAPYGIIQRGGRKVGIIESATAAGLALVPRQRRNPLVTTTYGVGELVLDAVKHGCREVIIGCGDSATNDGGAGLAQALGVRLLDANGQEIERGARALLDLREIKLDGISTALHTVAITVACNLTSILCGPDGTSRIYGPQKGASLQEVEILSNCMDRFAQGIQEITGLDVRYVPGGGGSGGLTTALFAFFGAKIRYSMSVIQEYLDIDFHVERANFVLTGEGQIDDRTAAGKLVGYLALVAKRYNVPVLAIAGQITPGAIWSYYSGIDVMRPISNGPITYDESLASAETLIEESSMQLARMIQMLWKTA